ncbi:MAG: protein-disulfide reductase DsbD family protein [Planctomycetota bacterium]
MFRTLLAALCALFALPALRAQEDPVQVSARFVPEHATPGSEVTLEVTLDVEAGWHVYGSKEQNSQVVAITLGEVGALRLVGKPEIPPGEKRSEFGIETYELKGKVVLKQKLKVPSDAKAGTTSVGGTASYAACDESHCIPPDEKPYTATLTIDGAGNQDAPKPATEPVVQGIPPLPGKSAFGTDIRVGAKARIEPAEAMPGSEVKLIVTVTVVEGWHVYGSAERESPATTLTLTDTGALRAIGGAEVPPGDEHASDVGATHNLYGTFEITQKLKVPETASGEQTVKAKVDYQACDESTCEMATNVAVVAKVAVAGSRGVPQPESVPKTVSWEMRTEPTDPRAGEAVDVVVSIGVPPGMTVWGKADSNPTRLLSKDPKYTPVGSNRAIPDGTPTKVDGAERSPIHGKFEIRQAVRLPKDAKAGALALPFELTYELADADGRLPERTETLSVPVDVHGGDARDEFLGAEFVVADFGGLLGLLLAAIGAGLLALLMPCTYPMIPITISFFTKQAANRGGSVLPLALAYGFGIVLIFVLIGLVAAPVIVPFATHWLTNAVITAAFLFFALSLFGLINLQPPQFLLNAAGKASASGGYLGVFLMGATLVVTSFTCTVPVAGALLSLASQGGTRFVMLGMAVFGLTMAIPFVALSLIPGRLRKMPRAGEWMNTLKVFLGFVEIAAAMKFASNMDIALHDGEPRWLLREPFLWVWAALFLGAAIYLVLPILKGARLAPMRAFGVVFSLAFAGYSTFGALGNVYEDVVMSALAPPMTHDPSHHEKVKDDYQKALELAKQEKKLLLVNFTGFQCVNCRVMEQTVLPAPNVAALLEPSFVEARIHTDHPNPEKGEANRALQMQMLGYLASPYYFVVDPATGRVMGQFKLPNVREDWKTLFAQFLQEMLGRSR